MRLVIVIGALCPLVGSYSLNGLTPRVAQPLARSGRSYIEEFITNGDPTAILFAAALSRMDESEVARTVDEITAYSPNDNHKRLAVISRSVIRNCESNVLFKPLFMMFAKPLFVEDPTPAGDALLIELGRTAFEFREDQFGVLQPVRRSSRTALFSPWEWTVVQMKVSYLFGDDFDVPRERILALEPKVIAFIGMIAADEPHRMERLDELHGSSQYCFTLGSWGYTIRYFLENAAAASPNSPTASFWETIGSPILRKECPERFGSFSERRDFFHRVVARPSSAHLIVMIVNRATALSDSLRYYELYPELFKSTLSVIFEGEQPDNPNSSLREWFRVVCRQILLTEDDLFEPIDESHRMYRLRRSFLNFPRNVEFVGEFFARAIIDKQPLPVTFSSEVYKYFMVLPQSAPIDMNDCESNDPEKFAHLSSLLTMDPASVEFINATAGLTFRDLVYRGEETPVTADNRKEYVRAVCVKNLELSGAAEEFFEKFHSGNQFWRAGYIFTVSEFQEMISNGSLP